MTIPMSDVRERLARSLEACLGEDAQPYARFIQGEEAASGDAPVPCWGAIFERFIEAFPTAPERSRAFEALVAAGDARPIFLFVHLAREDGELWSAVVEAAPRLPIGVQRLVASLHPPESWPVAWSSALSAEARQTGADPDRRVREVEQFEARLGELLAFSWFVPSTSESHPE
ncbi:MAG: hypothetical protein EA423_00830 [Phycisphaerales bacterium]|nr:MAG: hypothetical protein EA423_00830 [Phycisphaerales bacterium]